MDKATADRVMELVKTISACNFDLGEYAGTEGDGMAPHPDDLDDPRCDTEWPRAVLKVAHELKCAETELKLLLYHL